MSIKSNKDPKVLDENEISLIMSSTGKSREDVINEHAGFLVKINILFT